MSLYVYKTLHVVGMLLLFTALGSMIQRVADGGERPKLAGATHGVALLLLLVAGFGAMARLGLTHDWAFPGWVWAKLGIWLLLGAAPVLIRRGGARLATLWWWLLPLVGGLAGYLALAKPL
jgi:hypothetical protein